MEQVKTKSDIISQLRKDILQWEGYKPPSTGTKSLIGLGPIESAFPNGVFPLGTIHELVCRNKEQATASGGFVCGLLSILMKNGGVCLWIGLSGDVFPLALKSFGVEPDKMIFIHLFNEKDLLWVMEEALKCKGLAAVICEIRELNFKQSRRLQLAVEQSHVTGFILRNQSAKIDSTACAARWKIRPLPSQVIDGVPGLGFPRWEVELLRVRKGQPGSWVVDWSEGRFSLVIEPKVRHQKLMVG